MRRDTDLIEDAGKAVGIALLGVAAYHLGRAALPLLSHVAAEYGRTTKKADKGNHELLGRVDVVEPQCHASQPGKGRDHAAHQVGGVAAGLGRGPLNERHYFLDNFLPINFGKRLFNRLGRSVQWFNRRNVFVHGRGLSYQRGGDSDDMQTATMDTLTAHIVATTREAMDR